MNSRRLIASPEANDRTSYRPRLGHRKGVMSALGQKGTYAVQYGMSALLPIATTKADFLKNHVRFTPESGRVQRTRPCPLWAKSGHWPRRKKDRLAAVFRNCAAPSSEGSVASGHWQTDALFFELFPHPLEPLVIREGDRAGIPKALQLTRRIVDVSFHEFF